MNPIIVYYHVSTMEGIIMMVITSKSFWDAHQYLDDGHGPEYEKIYTAMDECGYMEAQESMYELESMDEVATIIAAMRSRGFEFQKDATFSAVAEGECSW